MLPGKCPSGSIPACAGEPKPQLRAGLPDWVYPRVCGGTMDIATSAAIRWGLSPRVRGNLDRHAAGLPEKKVYPRVCGGTAAPALFGLGGVGLSPRVRGNRAGQPTDWWLARSIPACAGEPRRSHCGTQSGGVYPRVCGGTGTVTAPVGWLKGLSPRVRGNPRRSFSERTSRRSIPACAGEPSAAAAGDTDARVYPRVCGGTPSLLLAGGASLGLSPRVRGNPFPLPDVGIRQGSIPACAGEPPALWPPESSRRVYPRVCGGTQTRFRSAY